ncbi:HAMP domain-containing histidine kinase [Nocardioides rubriscoriae]|uniref:HAMP domain-containing histidine kinase n=1 Tax=Nocardioides rubriscoriae TaxID=642762 RepID=UPI0011DFCC59|nr:HAMP domain-containing histidine kinase [Nocardioides rubriscoriae]
MSDTPGAEGGSDGLVESSYAAFMHDFHEMLAVVQGFSELAALSEPDESPAYLGRVNDGTERLAAMTDDLVARLREARCSCGREVPGLTPDQP